MEDDNAEVKHVWAQVSTVDGQTFTMNCEAVSIDENFINLKPVTDSQVYDYISFPIQNVVSLASKRIYKE